jgi:two-component system NtrC family response regulator
MSGVLVVDSDQLHLELLSSLLKQQGYDVHSTSRPEVALDVLSSQAIDLVIMETALPGHDGERLARQICQLNTQIPLTIVSERAEEEQTVQGLTRFRRRPAQ